MPELPDITIYIEALESRVRGEPLAKVRIAKPFVVRSVDPPIASVAGKEVRELRRLGKRIAFGFDDELYLVFHLMIAGRFRWREPGAPIPKKIGLAGLDFPRGSLIMTEAGTKKRASIHAVRGTAALGAHDPGGLEVLGSRLEDFRAALTRENHTLKRALTSPYLFSGIGNAYSDEILHAARLSPLQLTQRLCADAIARLHRCTQQTLERWIRLLREEVGVDFPEKVTAFRPAMAVHGRYGQPCRECARPIQRIVYAQNEVNYCAHCQTGGKILADRALSRLLRKDWPRSLDEWEQMRAP